MAKTKLATYNVNGIMSRLDKLLEWLEREAPDIVCLQELKAEDTGFPRKALRDAGYGAVFVGQKSWNGVAILARDADPIEVRRGLPGDAKDTQGRYIEAAVDGLLVACLYLPNGNPQPGPKFDYKLAWFERLIRHAATLQKCGHAVVMAGDYNVIPTDFDIYNTRSWLKDALLQPASRECYGRLLAQGWTDSIRKLHPDERIYTFWDYFRQHWEHNSGLRIDHLLLNETLAPRLVAAGVDTWVRGRPGASDHAPTWIVLDDAPKKVARKRAAPARKSVKRAPAK
ncbi:MAG TPA: exodeoxyribonuclease III [Rhodanobacteraceae bacterium]|nr:exodeoxyribonuclease III [Rhodanobacteraceae bacterium]